MDIYDLPVLHINWYTFRNVHDNKLAFMIHLNILKI